MSSAVMSEKYEGRAITARVIHNLLVSRNYLRS
jgi:hypothetical protein